MEIRYFTDTDTLYVELNEHPVAETQKSKENRRIDLDVEGNLVALTVEQARRVTDLSKVSLHQVMSQPA